MNLSIFIRGIFIQLAGAQDISSQRIQLYCARYLDFLAHHRGVSCVANVTVTECLSKPTSQLAAERRSQGKQGPTFAICVCFYITVSALSTDFDTFSDLILVYCFLRAVLCPALSIAAACCSLWSANNWHSKSRAAASVEAPRVADELLAARCSF